MPRSDCSAASRAIVRRRSSRRGESLARDAALGEDETEARDADLGPVLHDLLQAVALEQGLA